MQASEIEVIQQAIAILDGHLKTKGVELVSPEMVRAFLRLQLEQEQREVFAVLFLDTRHRVLQFNRMFTGTINQAAVYPREVVKVGLSLNASAAIVCHNHPSGDSTPSMADRQLTKKLKEALELVDIRLLDHFVIGHAEMFSFAEMGWI
ncbi:DNA repair protein RadC [Pseudomonas sp. MWU12-2115]|uniref:RadC family protein n=1 Tax=unclassified Pseudomonas TaxID=196821 RepID=UPI000CD4D75F|nr:DNA repair protein RadC [Pseudomonas sp. MWU12-2020]RBB97320.1 DNA repair protein RadC [Pseudomonas sp. MWU12-2115]